MAVEMSEFARGIMEHKYAHQKADGTKETWEDIAHRVVKNVMRTVGWTMRDAQAKELRQIIIDRKFLPGGRYLYASGREFHQVQNCLLLRAGDSREEWADLMQKSTMALMTGAGIGIDYSTVREEGAIIRKTGGQATGPIALMQMINEAGRGIMQGGSRRSAIWAGLNWNHPDILKFISLKDWHPEVKKLKEKDFSFPATMDMTNISVQLDDEFFDAYHTKAHPKHSHAHAVYWEVVRHMLETGEPGFSVDTGKNSGETLRNACTEVTSADDSDICNLGSINFAAISDETELRKVTELVTIFLLAGTLYSHVPYAKVDQIRTKNRRIGLGVMGLHEWLLTRGKPYGPDLELGTWMEAFQEVSDATAANKSKEWKISAPVKVRAIAPTGTIGIIAETTTGCEPIYCVAYRRRYLKHRTWHYQYVVDPVARRLINNGVSPESIEDAYTLAEDVERRIEFQSWLQQYIDHGISSTINLPPWGSMGNCEQGVQKFGNTLIRYLPNLRGITVYPDGARGGQPLTPVRYATALKHEGQDLVEEQANVCDISKGGSCGD